MESDISTKRLEPSQLQQAASLLQRGGVVAFPTETVYGLGANAFAPEAIAKIFEAKGRPSDNPLIAHIADIEQLSLLASEVPELATLLFNAFWPGPLTLVLKKQPAVPNEVTAGLDTVAIRMPRDPIARELIRLADTPLVAPSANRSGKPSATTWQAVLEDLEGRIDAVVCGDPTQLGIESTVIDVTSREPVILRHGSITEEMIAEVLRDAPEKNSKIVASQISSVAPHASNNIELEKRSPGTRHRHYQPQAQVRLCSVIEGNVTEGKVTERKVTEGTPIDNPLAQPTEPWAWIGLSAPPKQLASIPKRVEVCDSIEVYASKLYTFFRSCDAEAIPTIYCEKVPAKGLGRALMDRLSRAAASADGPADAIK